MKRIAGYALMASPVVLVLALDTMEHGFWLAVAKLAVVLALAAAVMLGIKWTSEP